MAIKLTVLLKKFEDLLIFKDQLVDEKILNGLLEYLQKNNLEDEKDSEPESPENLIIYYNPFLQDTILDIDTSQGQQNIYKHEIRRLYDEVVEVLVKDTELETQVQKFYSNKQAKFFNFFDDVVKFFKPVEEKEEEKIDNEEPSAQDKTPAAVATASTGRFGKSNASESTSDQDVGQTVDDIHEEPTTQKPVSLTDQLRLNRYDRAYLVSAIEFSLLQEMGIDPKSPLYSEIQTELTLLRGMLSDKLAQTDLNSYLDANGRITITGKRELLTNLVLTVHADGAFEDLKTQLQTKIPVVLPEPTEQDATAEKVQKISANQLVNTAIGKHEDDTDLNNEGQVNEWYAKKTDLEFKKQMAEIAAFNSLNADIGGISSQILEDLSQNQLKSLNQQDIEQYLVGAHKDFFAMLSPAQKNIVAGQIKQTVEARNIVERLELTVEAKPSESVHDQITSHLRNAGIDPESIEGINIRKRLVSTSLAGGSTTDLASATLYATSSEQAKLLAEYEQLSRLLSADQVDETNRILQSLSERYQNYNQIFEYSSNVDEQSPDNWFQTIEGLTNASSYNPQNPNWDLDTANQIINYSQGIDGYQQFDGGAPINSRSSLMRFAGRKAFSRLTQKKVKDEATKIVAKEGAKLAGKSLVSTVGIPVAGGLGSVAVGAMLAQVGQTASLLGGAAVGAGAGFLVGGPVGALIGGGLGAIGGKIGFDAVTSSALPSINNVTPSLIEGAANASKALSGSSSAVTSNIAQTAAGAGQQAGGMMPGTSGFGTVGTGVGWGFGVVSVGAPILMIAGVTAKNMNDILWTFTPDANVENLGPQPDEFSRYVNITKTASPKKLENNESATISYTVTISPKNEFTIMPTGVKDTYSFLGGADAVAPEIPDQTDTILNTSDDDFELNKLIDTRVQINYEVENVSGIDVLASNTFELTFDVLDASGAVVTSGQTLKALSSVTIGDPQIGCFKFGEAGFAFPGNFRSVNWNPGEQERVMRAFLTRAASNASYVNLICGEGGSKGDVTIYRLPGSEYGGWAPSALQGSAIGLYDLGLKYSDASTEYTLIHELGHIIDYRNPGLRQKFIQARTSSTCFTYPIPSLCSGPEAFAEGSMLYVVYTTYAFSGGRYETGTAGTYNFKQKFPTEFNWFKQNLFGGAECGASSCVE